MSKAATLPPIPLHPQPVKVVNQSSSRSYESKRSRLLRLASQLKSDRSSWDSHYRDLGEHIFTRRTRFFEQDRNRGDKRNGKIINATGTLAARTLRAGMLAGMTSPARPWRRLTTPDPDMAEFGPIKEWLYTVNKRMTAIDLRSNLYQCLPNLYGDAGVFATGCMIQVDDPEDFFRYYSFPVGSYWLACNQRQVVDTFYREFQLSVRQVVEMFGDPHAGPNRRWDNFSSHIQGLYDQGNYETPVSIAHWILPNEEYDPNKLESKYKRYASIYYEYGTQTTQGQQTDAVAFSPEKSGFLQEKGFDLFRVLAPRWDVTGEDTYGTSCPGMDALGDIRELQLLEKRTSRCLEKQINPPLTGPTSLRTQKASLLPGDITYLDVREGQQGLRSIHETNMSIKDVRAEIEIKERRIQRTFYEDLFLMLANMEGIQPRNEMEIAERHEEKLLALGQTLERFNDELLDPMTDLAFFYMNKYGLIPPPPPEIAGQNLRIEYVSIMAQAQKLVGVSGMERFVGFVGNMAGAFPQVLDKVNADHIVDDYGDAMGVSALSIVSDDAVKAIRDARAKQQQQEQAAKNALMVAQGAKLLSDADMSKDNALTRATTGVQ